MLYLCATPIGNLGDITERVLDTLREVDLIAAEDTRNSLKLLTHFDIHTPMTSYHEYNKVEKARELIDKMHGGMDIALITDAGTPAISDPGEVLVRMCREEGVPVTSLPGACACITALTLSGFSTRRFSFEGFLPSDKKERQAVLTELKAETRTTVLYEAPHHLVKALKDLLQTLGDRRITLCRELTKRFESVETMTIAQALEKYEHEEPRGEFVLVLEGRSRSEQLTQRMEEWLSISIPDHMNLYEAQGMDRKEAMKRVARDRGVGKRDIYSFLLEHGDECPRNEGSSFGAHDKDAEESTKSDILPNTHGADRHDPNGGSGHGSKL
ncbi:MAG: 16S rRNA (cytidine(1402)-2'-O)-methyltransferase [Lachnospiraceae bacterium]|nr:16S rRNA (cytidine(1402)-2'-O)-methyltransferase [Lachnospiraceae bacterium]